MQDNHSLSDISSLLAVVIAAAGLLVSALGWYVTYRLSVGANKDLLRRTILNEARHALSNSIFEYVDWCGQVHARLSNLQALRDSAWALANPQLFSGAVRELREVALTDRRQFMWLRCLECYEPLFPRTREVRIQLLKRNRSVVDALQLGLAGAEGDPSALLACVPGVTQQLFDMIALSWDVLVHAQNECLGELSGYTVALREPVSPRSVVIRSDVNGLLTIVETAGFNSEESAP